MTSDNKAFWTIVELAKIGLRIESSLEEASQMRAPSECHRDILAGGRRAAACALGSLSTDDLREALADLTDAEVALVEDAAWEAVGEGNPFLDDPDPEYGPLTEDEAAAEEYFGGYPFEVDEGYERWLFEQSILHLVEAP